MEANELRIGNQCKEITHSFNGVVKVSKRHFEDIEDGEIDLFPILLTEEWLIKFGFEKIVHNSEEEGYGTNYRLKIDRHSTINIEYDFSFGIESNDGRDDVIFENDFIKSVHRLQNLYFALTNKELNIK